MSNTSLENTFRFLKRRMLAIGGASGVAWGCCAAVGLLMAGVWLDLVWELSAGARIAALLLAIIAGLALAARFVVGAVSRAREVMLARRLDETGQTGGQIVSGFELHMSGGASQSATAPGLTRALAELAISRAAGLAAQIPRTIAVPSQPVRRAAIGAAALLVGVAILSAVAPRLASTEFMRFSDPFGDHPPFSRTALHVEPGDTKVRYGDGLDVIVSAEGPPAEELELVLRAGASAGGNAAREESLPMFPESSGRWRATVSSVTSPGQYFVRARAVRSRRFDLDVITVPQLEQVRFRVTPPVYTRDATYEGPLPQGGLSGLAGTVVEVHARSNRPLSSGTMEIVNGEKRVTVRLEPTASDGGSHEVAGTWTIAAAGTFQLKVTDIAGQESRDSLQGPINVLADQSPFVRLLEPAPQSLATPSVSLPVVVAAEDDYGITKLQLFRSLNDSRALPLSLNTESPPARRQAATTQLPLSEYGLRPGDVIKLFARVEDNDPAGAKGSESPVAVIQIVSDEDFQKMLRAREGMDVLLSKYQQAQRRLEALQAEIDRLQKQLEKRDAEGALTDEEKQALEKLAERIAEEAEAVRESAKQELPYDLDKELNSELEKLADQMQEASEEAKAAAGQSKPSAGETAKKLADIKKKLGDQRKEFEKGVTEPLDRLSEIYPLLEDQSRFVELYHRQRDLAERLASLKERENPDDPAAKARMRDLETEQRKNREELDQLLNDIETHAARVPTDDPKLQQLADSAREFVDAVRASGANQAMSDAEAGLAEFSGSRGHAEAKNAADILEQFLSRCQGMGDQAGEACQGLKFKPGEGCLGDTLSQLLADAGLKPGGKRGQNGQQGAGGGYSARRSTLNNIGMYGQIPTRGNPTQSRGGSGKQAISGSGNFGTSADRARASRLDPHGMLNASGTSDAAVPARYRSRVEQYFQRIAEETGGK